MAHRHKAQARHSGIKDAELDYGDKDVVKEAKSTKETFKKGGKVHGKKGKHRLDKRARGGRVGYKSPFSSARTSEKGNLT